VSTVSLSPRGVSLAELATALDAAKSSVQELSSPAVISSRASAGSTSGRGRSSWLRARTSWRRSPWGRAVARILTSKPGTSSTARSCDDSSRL
jgi:hypothetical protein